MVESTMEDKVVEARKKMKELKISLTKMKPQMNNSEQARYISLAITELQSSRHWMGELLGEVIGENPYKR